VGLKQIRGYEGMISSLLEKIRIEGAKVPVWGKDGNGFLVDHAL